MTLETMSTLQSFYPLADNYYIAAITTDDGTDYWLCRAGENGALFMGENKDVALDAAKRYTGDEGSRP